MTKIAEFEALLTPYNPWLKEGKAALEDLPTFKRPIFQEIMSDIAQLPQILSITGPRRIGKSTILKQVIRHHLEAGIPADHLIYYSFDDPSLDRPGFSREDFIHALMVELHGRAKNKPVLLFLDEIQKLERWELFLKKYYDLKYQIRLVISGSAASPIFKKSRESLLGRVKDYHLLPFSFREFMLYHCQNEPALVRELTEIHEGGMQILGMIFGDPKFLELTKAPIPRASTQLRGRASTELNRYYQEGGFPEVWTLPTWEKKIDYLADNQIQKVIFEDLVLAAEFRKPEILKRFYISLLEKPGRELNLTQAAQELNIEFTQIQKYLPMLEMTDLLAHIEKFRTSPIRVRKGNIKIYLVDLALRNAILRLDHRLLDDFKTLGLYAENLVFSTLRKWKGKLALDYYRETKKDEVPEKSSEVDFIVHQGHQFYLPIEVKYQENIHPHDYRGLKRFQSKYRASPGILVTKNLVDSNLDETIRSIPLIDFLLMFDI